MSDKNKKRDTTLCRHREWYESFQQFIKAEGEKAKLFEKKYFYGLVADKYNVSADYAAVVIRQFIKDSGSKCERK